MHCAIGGVRANPLEVHVPVLTESRTKCGIIACRQHRTVAHHPEMADASEQWQATHSKRPTSAMHRETIVFRRVMDDAREGMWWPVRGLARTCRLAYGTCPQEFVTSFQSSLY